MLVSLLKFKHNLLTPLRSSRIPRLKLNLQFKIWFKRPKISKIYLNLLNLQRIWHLTHKASNLLVVLIISLCLVIKTKLMKNLMIKLKKNWKSRKKRIKLPLKFLPNLLQKKLKFKNTLTTYHTKKGNTPIYRKDTPQITNTCKNYLKRRRNLTRQCLILRQPLPH